MNKFTRALITDLWKVIFRLATTIFFFSLLANVDNLSEEKNYQHPSSEIFPVRDLGVVSVIFSFQSTRLQIQ